MLHDDYQLTRQPNSLSGEPLEETEYPPSFPRIGQKLLDRYEIHTINKKGGFGIVFFVTDLKTNRDYAVKTYKPEFAGQFSSIEQFKAEIDFWINLEPHPNIVRAYFVEVIQNQPYLFMEYIRGSSLRDRLGDSLKQFKQERELLRDSLKQFRPEEEQELLRFFDANHLRGFDANQAIHFVYQLCLGMEFANRKREVAHCDLKPENILIDEQGILKVTDFGLARRIQVKNGIYPRLDAGTWAYTPPEMFSGQAMNSQSDIFALGVIFYEMLTGKLPYPFELSRDPKTQFKQLSDFHSQNRMHELSQKIYYADIPDMPIGLNNREVNHIISGCLDHFSSERFRSFAQLREQLEYQLKLQPLSTSSQPSHDDSYQRALSLHKIGRYSEALSVFNRLLQQHPNEGQLWLDAARTLLEIGDLHTAQRFLYQVLHLNPQLVEAEQLLKSL